MLDSFFLLWQWPWLRVCFGLYGALLVVSLVLLARRRGSSLAHRWQVALCLALCLTPSTVTDFFVAAFIGPAMVGLLFSFPLLFTSGQPFQALLSVGLLYLLPLAVAFALFYVAYPWYSQLGRRRDVPRA